MKKAAQIFLIFGIIKGMILFFPSVIGLIFYSKLKNAKQRKDISFAWKIVVLLLVDLVAGIILFCMKDGHYSGENLKAGKLAFSVTVSIIASFFITISVTIFLMQYESEISVKDAREIISILHENSDSNFSAKWGSNGFFTVTLEEGKSIKGNIDDFVYGDCDDILHINKEYIYYLSIERGYDIIYRVKHGEKSGELVYKYERDAVASRFINDNTLYYQSGGKYYLYYFDSQTVTETEKLDYFYDSKYEIDCERSFWQEITGVPKAYALKNKATGETRTLNLKDTRERLCAVYEAINFAEGNNRFIDAEIIQVKGELYFVFYTKGAAINFEYDFENDAFNYHSYLNIADVSFEYSNFNFG